MKRRPAKTRTRKTTRATKPIAAESPLTPYDPQAAAIDVGATSHWVAVSPEGRAESVREFGVFTADLYAIADWLKALPGQTRGLGIHGGLLDSTL